MDKKIVITGATSGLGRALAERFVAEGWRVGAAGRNARALAELSRLSSPRPRIAPPERDPGPMLRRL